jgi:N-methylhydantoinase B
LIRDPIEFELFKNSVFSVADEMALTIFRTTYSGLRIAPQRGRRQ